MSKRRRREIPIIDFSIDDVVIDGRDLISTLPDDLMKEITKRLTLSDLTRLGLTSKNMKRLTSVEIANIMDDPLLQKLAQRYKSRLMRPFDTRIYSDPDGNNYETYHLPIKVANPQYAKTLDEERGGEWWNEYLKDKYDYEDMVDQLGYLIDRGRN